VIQTIAMVFAVATVSSLYAEVQVISGGATHDVGGGSPYRATWTFKPGWWENGSVYYDPQSSNSYRFEWQALLTTANARWSDKDKALNTLHIDYYFNWHTADFDDVHEFDDEW
jgi:hypothetical protein